MPLLLVIAACRAATPGSGGPYRNLFQELLGKSDAEVDAKVAAAWARRPSFG